MGSEHLLNVWHRVCKMQRQKEEEDAPLVLGAPRLARKTGLTTKSTLTTKILLLSLCFLLLSPSLPPQSYPYFHVLLALSSYLICH